MPSRREALYAFIGIAGSAGGCLSRIRPTNYDTSADHSVVKYEELSARGQEFVDAAIGDYPDGCGGDVHRYSAIIRDSQRIYVRFDQTTGRYVPIDDPLTLGSVDGELEQVFGGPGVLLKKGEYLFEGQSRVYIGHPGKRFAGTDADGCREVVHRDNLSGMTQDLADLLLEEGDAMIAERKYEVVYDADIVYNETSQADLFETLDALTGNNAPCLKGDTRSIRVTGDFSVDKRLDYVYELTTDPSCKLNVE